jgi:hypothetical protein
MLFDDFLLFEKLLLMFFFSFLLLFAFVADGLDFFGSFLTVFSHSLIFKNNSNYIQRILFDFCLVN